MFETYRNRLDEKVQELLRMRKQFPPDNRREKFYYPPIFKTLISYINELNESFAQLISNDVTYLKGSRRIAPVMILRSLIDSALLLKAYLLYPNKEVFIKHYANGNEINKLCIKQNGEKQRFTTNYLKSELNKDFDGIADLYSDCCEWVHPNYSETKFAQFPLIGCGRHGFRGKQYPLKIEDFSFEEIINGEVDEYDYEEECDITDCVIFINQVIIDLFKEIELVFIPSEKDISGTPYSVINLPPTYEE